MKYFLFLHAKAFEKEIWSRIFILAAIALFIGVSSITCGNKKQQKIPEQGNGVQQKVEVNKPERTNRLWEKINRRGITKEELDKCPLVVEGEIESIEPSTARFTLLNWVVTISDAKAIRGTLKGEKAYFLFHSPSRTISLEWENMIGRKGKFYGRTIEGTTDSYELFWWWDREVAADPEEQNNLPTPSVPSEQKDETTQGTE